MTSFRMYENICLNSREVLTLPEQDSTLGLRSQITLATHIGKQHIDNIVCGNMVNWEKETVGFCLRVLYSLSSVTTLPLIKLAWDIGASSLTLNPGGTTM